MTRNSKFFWSSALLIGAILAILTQGCTWHVKPGADAIVVYAEAAAEEFTDISQKFVAWERRNEVFIKAKAPDVHKFANEVRDNGKLWHDDLRRATKAYKLNRTPSNRTELETAKGIIDIALDEMRRHMAEGAQ
jgi:hypothetical protein